MNPSFSIISTLIEAVRLVQRHARLVFVLTLICGVTAIAIQLIATEIVPSIPRKGPIPPDQAGMMWFFFLASFAMGLVAMALSIAAHAAILGMLKTPALGSEAWPVIMNSIRRYMWRLFILGLLLGLIAGAITIPFSFLIFTFGFHSGHSSYVVAFISMMAAIVYLIFAKYALADPLIVAENLNPLDALGRSWQMTRGRFGYVVGCYVFVGTAEYFLTQLLQHFERTSIHTFTWLNVVDVFLKALISCYWIFLSWVMYTRIKATEAPHGESAPLAPTSGAPDPL